MIALSETPTSSMSWSKKARCTSLNGDSEAISMTPRTSPSKSTGSTMMFTGVASPRPDFTLM